jgi:hypothetical protein
VVPTFYTLLTRKRRDDSAIAAQAMAESHGDGSTSGAQLAPREAPAPTPSVGS